VRSGTRFDLRRRVRAQRHRRHRCPHRASAIAPAAPEGDAVALRRRREPVVKFVQIIEYQTSRSDEISEIMDQWMAATEGKRTPTREITGRDRDDAGRYLQIVEFPSYDDAMRNSALPETSQFAERIQALCDGPAVFRNLDVVREENL
jgi:hypothetical protein